MLFAVVFLLPGGGAAQAATPLLRLDFEAGTVESGGWLLNPVGSFGPAAASLGSLPSSPVPNYPSPGQRGLRIEAQAGQARLLIGPGVTVGSGPALIRMQVLATASGGSVAIGALNYPSTGGIGQTEGSVTYSLEMDSSRFVGAYQPVVLLYRPKGQALAPVIQLAVPAQAGQPTVTLVVDNVEVYALDNTLVADPTLRDLFGISTGGTNPTPTPTVTPGPTGNDIFMDEIYTVSSVDDAYPAFEPRVAYDQNNMYSMVASDQTSGFQDIVLRNVDAALPQESAVSDGITVNHTFEETVARDPDLDIDFAGTRHVVWSDNRDTEKLYSIYMNELDSSGNRLNNEDDYMLNRTFEGTNAKEPSLAVQDDGNMVVTWYDDRSYLNDIIVRRMRWDGAKLQYLDAKDFPVNVPFDKTNANDPDVAVDALGNIAVVWSDDRILLGAQKRKDVYARVFTMQTPLTADGKLPATATEISLSDTNNTVLDHATRPRVAESSGYFVTVWENSASTAAPAEIHGAILGGQGNLLQNEFLVSDSNANFTPIAPSIAAYQEGIFLITWQDSKQNKIYGRLLDAKRSQFLTEPLSLLDSVAGTTQTSVAAGGEQRFLLGWDSKIGTLLDVFAALGQVQVSGINISGLKTLYPETADASAKAMGVSPLSKEEHRSARETKPERSSGKTEEKRQ